MQKERKNVVIVLGAITVLLLGAIIYLLFVRNYSNLSTSLINDDNVLNVYPFSALYINSNNCVSSQYNSSNKIIYQIKTDTSNAQILSIGGSNDYFKKGSLTYLCNNPNPEYIVYYDNGIEVYNTKSKISKKLNLPKQYSFNDAFAWNFINYGIIYSHNKEAFYYDIKNDKLKFASYEEILPVLNGNQNSSEFVIGRKGNSFSLLSINTEKAIVSRSTNHDYIDYEVVSLPDGKNMFVSSVYGQFKTDYILYTDHGKEIYHLNNNEVYRVLSDENYGGKEAIVIVKNSENITQKYDINGNKVN